VARQGENRVDPIIERGLDKYVGGDLLGAINEWERALAIDPACARATEYIQYVRDNFDLLNQQFAAARAGGQPVPGLRDDADTDGAGRPALSSADGGDDDYAEVELDGRDARAPMGSPARTVVDTALEIDDDLAEINAGLAQVDIDPVDDLLGPPARQHAGELEGRGYDLMGPSGRSGTRPDRSGPAGPAPGTRPPVLTIQPRTGGMAAGGASAGSSSPAARRGGVATPPRSPVPELDFALDVAPPGGEFSTPVPSGDEPDDERRRTARAAVTRGDEESARSTRPRPGQTGFSDEAPTRERHTSANPFADLELTSDDEFADAHSTKERAPFRKEPTPTGVRPAPGKAPPAVIIDEQLLNEVPSAAPVRPPSPTAPPIPGDPIGARIYRRVTDLLALAREAAERADFRSAIEAAEAASAEDPEDQVAPAILDHYKDLMNQIYEGYIGDMNHVPLLAVPMHEISAQSLDHKTGFLLSRIDGMLTFEDILDVSGMPRMEAFKIISYLLRKGVIEVRG
jgi:hypothetical protein